MGSRARYYFGNEYSGVLSEECPWHQLVLAKDTAVITEKV